MEDFQLDLLIGDGPTARSIRLQGDRLVLPGGAATSTVWRKLVGASPDESREFLLFLLV